MQETIELNGLHVTFEVILVYVKWVHFILLPFINSFDKIHFKSNIMKLFSSISHATNRSNHMWPLMTSEVILYLMIFLYILALIWSFDRLDCEQEIFTIFLETNQVLKYVHLSHNFLWVYPSELPLLKFNLIKTFYDF